MKLVRAALILARHVWLVWRAGQIRFRLETFGLYYPALPYTRPFWRPSRRSVIMLLRQSVAYAQWVVAMEQWRHTRVYPGSLHVSPLWLQADIDWTLGSRQES